MSTDRDVDRIVRSWMDEGVTALPDRVLDAVLDQLPATPQRRTFFSARRLPIMNRFVGVALAAATVVIVAFIGIGVLGGPNSGGPGPDQTPSQMPTATPPTASPVPTGPTDTEVRNGPLVAGRYAYLNVDEEGFNVAFTVPAGWTWNGRYLSKGGVGPPDGAAIFFFGGPVQVYADPCHWAGTPWTPPTDLSVTRLMAALAAQQSRSATVPINRHLSDDPAGILVPAMSVELTVPISIDFATCDRGEFRSWGPDGKAMSAQGPGQRDLVWAVDMPGAGVDNGQGVIIVPPPVGGLIIDAASFPGTPADVMSEIEAILVSIYAGHWG